MHINDKENLSDVLDATQLVRIEAVHRGFLYQHLYAVGCMLLAQAAEVDAVMIELDEDIELITKQGRIYVQVKTRSKPIIPSNISGAIKRFENLRKEHADGKRKGEASFIIVANQAPSSQLQQTIDNNRLPPDVLFVWPQSTSERQLALPPAWESLTDAATWCIAQADKLNFSLLSPDTLIWKLAGLVQLAEHKFGFREQVAYAMKKMLFSAENGDAREVQRLVEQAGTKLPDAEHVRIFDYNHAIALWKLKKYNRAESLCWKVIKGYYDLLGIRPQDVMGKNPDVLWTIINQPENVQDHLKHLADALELYARNIEAQGKLTPFIRINSMKFYYMAGAPESMVRVGQDLADEFVAIKQYEGAKEVIEQHVLPVVKEAGLINRLVQVRSQYAVILALCGQHDDANTEMQRLGPYIEGLTDEQSQEVEDQSNYIAQLAYDSSKPSIKKIFGKVGRNERCPCGSGLKYKKCHGA